MRFCGSEAGIRTQADPKPQKTVKNRINRKSFIPFIRFFTVYTVFYGFGIAGLAEQAVIHGRKRFFTVFYGFSRFFAVLWLSLKAPKAIHTLYIKVLRTESHSHSRHKLPAHGCHGSARKCSDSPCRNAADAYSKD